MLLRIKNIIIWLNTILLFGYAKPVWAITKDPYQRLENVSGAAGYNVFSKPPFQTILLTIVQYLLGLLGMIFVAVILYSGFQWMTSAGNEEKITKAKSNLLNAVIGLLIIAAAYAITWFVADVLIKATIEGYYYSYP